MALEGTLDDMSLSDLFQMFQMGEKTGTLTLTAYEGHGIVYVCAGRLIDAVVIGAGARSPHVTGSAAVLDLLGWQRARFVFTYDPSVAARPVAIRYASGWFVLQALRASSRQELSQRSSAVLDLDTLVEPGTIANSTEIGMGLSLEQWRILDCVTARMSLSRISREIRVAPDALTAHVAELVATGLLHVVAPGRAAPPPRQARVSSPLLSAIQRRIRTL